MVGKTLFTRLREDRRDYRNHAAASEGDLNLPKCSSSTTSDEQGWTLKITVFA
jgi:hypothetical protein